MNESANAHWLPESWFQQPPRSGKGAQWHICRDCLSPLAEFFERLVDGWDGGDQLIERIMRPRMSAVQFAGSEVREALNFLENCWGKPAFTFVERTKKGDHKVVESIERLDFGFAHMWLSVNVGHDFARQFRRMVRKPGLTVKRNDEWWRFQTEKVVRRESVGSQFVLTGDYEDKGAELWMDLVRTANFLRRAAIVVEAHLTNAMPKVGGMTPASGAREWSMPDYPSQWAEKFGMKLAAFNRMIKANKIRIKSISARKISVHVDDLPAERDGTTK